MGINSEYKFEGRWTVDKEHVIGALTNLIDAIRESTEIRQFNISVDHKLEKHIDKDGVISKRPTGLIQGDLYIEWLPPEKEGN